MSRLTRFLAFGSTLAMLSWFAVIVALTATPGTAFAHEERPAQAPDGTGHVPGYRTSGPTLLVCSTNQTDFSQRIAEFPDAVKSVNSALWTQCQKTGYRTIQAAVNAVDKPGMTIKILPGVYYEKPSLDLASPECGKLTAPTAALGYQVLSWEQQLACPNNQNLIAVLNKQDLQIEGTGATPTDVVIDAQYQKLNALRADRSSGIYLRNFTAQRTTFNAIYIMEADGFVIDRVIGRWNDEYGFLTFADDHGLYTDCEAYGNGDSGIYPGAASDINAKKGYLVERYAIEIQRCYSHHNLLGYSGTAGDSVWAHDNTFTDNSVGISTDSAFPNHPGLPQNHSRFERNVIADNNIDYYGYVRDGTCHKPYDERGYENGVVCPAVGVPVGTGVINPGGNYNIWRENWIYNNRYAGFVTAWVPGVARKDNRFLAQFDTSHHNRYFDNHMGVSPENKRAPNGMDFWWDGQGVGSCWQRPSADGSEPMVLPLCGDDDTAAGLGTVRYIGEPGKTLKLFACAAYDQRSQRIPTDCDWFGATGLERIEVKYALGEAILLGIVLLLIWVRLPRHSRRRRRGVGGDDLAVTGGSRRAGSARLVTTSLLVALAGLAVGVFGTLRETSPWTPFGLIGLGLGLVGCGFALRRAGRTRLAWLTFALALFALLGGVDRGLVMLPIIPVAPSVVRIALEMVWVPWALAASLAGPPQSRRS